MAGQKFIGGVDLVGEELSNYRDQNLAADPTPLGKGHRYFNTVTNKGRVFNGTVWEDSGGSVDLSDYVSKTSLTAQNVVSPIEFGNTVLIGAAATFNGISTFEEEATFNAAVIFAGTPTMITQTAGDNSTKGATTAFVQTEIANKVAGLLDDRGNFDASVNTFPVSGGSGTAGAILKGDVWRISVAGTLGGTFVTVGDTIRALVDAPAQTAANWAVLQTEELTAGLALSRTANTLDVTIATAAEAKAKAIGNKALAPSSLADFPYKSPHLIGDGTALSFTIAHGRGDATVIACVYEVSTGEQVYPKIAIGTTNVIVSGWVAGNAPTNDQYRVVIIG